MEGLFRVILLMSVYNVQINGALALGQNLGAIQYRIQQAMFQEVAPEIVRSPAGYTVRSDGVSVAGPSTTLVDSGYLMDRMTIDARAADNIKVSMPFDHHVIVQASFAAIRIEGHLIVKRSDEILFNGNFDVTLTDVTHKSMVRMDNTQETTFFGNDGSCVRPECKVEFGELIGLSAELLQNTSTEMTEADVTEMFERAVCKMYHLQFHMGFKGVSFRTSLGTSKLYVTATSSYQDLLNKTMYHTQMIDVSNTNVNPWQPPLQSLPTFPPAGPDAAPFEIWVHVSGFNRIIKTALSELTFPSPLHTLLPFFGDLTWDAKELFILPQLRKIFPNSTVTFMMESFEAEAVISDNKFIVRLSTNCTLMDTLKCDTNRSYEVFRMRLDADLDVQISHMNGSVSARFTGVSGNVTISDSKIGPIADRFLTSLVYVLPSYITEENYQSLNSKFIGLKIKDFVPGELNMDDVELRFVQDNVVLRGRLSTHSSTPNTNFTWTGNVTNRSDQYFRLRERIGEDAPILPQQNCSPYVIPKHTSGVTRTYDVKTLFLYNFILVSLVLIWC